VDESGDSVRVNPHFYFPDVSSCNDRERATYNVVAVMVYLLLFHKLPRHRSGTPHQEGLAFFHPRPIITGNSFSEDELTKLIAISQEPDNPCPLRRGPFPEDLKTRNGKLLWTSLTNCSRCWVQEFALSPYSASKGNDSCHRRKERHQPQPPFSPTSTPNPVQSQIVRGRYPENTPLEGQAAKIPKYQQKGPSQNSYYAVTPHAS
jgi:hypothetical protein